MMTNTDIAKLIELFHVVPVRTKVSISPKVVELVNQKAVKLGYIIHPTACWGEGVDEFLDNQKINYNSTFYKEWSDVTSKSRFELFVDQIIHYATTYGTDWSFEDNGYVPNEGAENVPDLKSYTIIYPCTIPEMFDRCKNMIYSGIALDSERTKLFCNYIVENIGVTGCEIDVDKIKNREAMVILCKELGILPRDRFNLMRYIFYVTTGQSMVIKNQDFINRIKYSMNPFDFSLLDESRMIELSKIFLRYKDLFLAFKHNTHTTPSTPLAKELVEKCLVSDRLKNCNYVINKIRRYAVKYHEPIKVGMWENILDTVYPLLEIHNALAEVSNFKLITLMQTIRERLLCAADGEAKQMYIVRNGKVYIKDSQYKNVIDSRYEYWAILYKMFEERLIENLRSKACIVKFPTELNLTCPTSEKNFVGNLPMGSNYEMKGENFFGIYWKEDWGTQDFDLSFTDTKTGYKVGWGARFRNDENSVIFSGDMTSARPEATEVLYCKGGMPEGVIKVNRYAGDENSRFKVFFGSQNIDPNTFDCGYMVDPNSIKMQTEEISTIREQMVGIVADNKAYMLNLRTGNVHSCHTSVSDMFEIFRRKSRSFIYLKDILLKAGFVEYDEKDEEMNKLENPIGLDLTDLKKDTLISLFSKEE